MGQYKLRLGDGTELTVDGNSLHTWAADEQAAVQTRSGWKPLRDILAKAQERAASRAEAPQRGTPPPSTSELPSLRLAQTSDEGPQDGEVWDDEVYDDGMSVMDIGLL